MAMNIDGTSIIYDVPINLGGTINGGYRCTCGAWVTNALGHHCPNTGPAGYTCFGCRQWVNYSAIGGHACPGFSVGGNSWQCPNCGQWVLGISHVCSPMQTNARFHGPQPAPACHHCYCIDVPPSGDRTKPHGRCCHCGDVHLRDQP